MGRMVATDQKHRLTPSVALVVGVLANGPKGRGFEPIQDDEF
jgi:hypothetical protein